ncbi:hypothetical protein [Paenibacillus sp. B2(2019)]|uniref:hypothetical protein n=1 Tax=Paenibacillus sp. B2(2019) TaxID=2607754 RepID=UPI0011F36B78|nr:hypothetical protein [Paenibacillus sp. B2(2019)]KAA1191119.1 hypothetical protein PAENI_02515 [Paenibacillus sp. B2(2019)]
MKKVVGSFIIATLLFASPAFATPLPQAEIASANQSQASKTIRNSIFNLSDQQMKNAIKIGNGGRSSYVNFKSSQEFSILYDKMKIWQPEVSLITPYSLIVGQSYIASNKYKEYTLADAKKVKKMFSNDETLTFNVTAYGNDIDFASNINIVLKQGAKIYQPLSIDGLDEMADTTVSWPDSPAYSNSLMPSFDINKIDFSKPAELIYLYAGKELSVTYKVDFSKIK